MLFDSNGCAENDARTKKNHVPYIGLESPFVTWNGGFTTGNTETHLMSTHWFVVSNPLKRYESVGVRLWFLYEIPNMSPNIWRTNMCQTTTQPNFAFPHPPHGSKSHPLSLWGALAGKLQKKVLICWAFLASPGMQEKMKKTFRSVGLPNKNGSKCLNDWRCGFNLQESGLETAWV